MVQIQIDLCPQSPSTSRDNQKTTLVLHSKQSKELVHIDRFTITIIQCSHTLLLVTLFLLVGTSLSFNMFLPRSRFEYSSSSALRLHPLLGGGGSAWTLFQRSGARRVTDGDSMQMVMITLFSLFSLFFFFSLASLVLMSMPMIQLLGFSQCKMDTLFEVGMLVITCRRFLLL